MRDRRLGLIWAGYTLAGTAIGYLFLHPATMIIYMLDQHPTHAPIGHMLAAVYRRMFVSFDVSMVTMGLFFAGLGGLLGFAAGWSHVLLIHRSLTMEKLRRALGRDAETMIQGGEGAEVEFKASLRWNLALGRVDKEMEKAVVKTLCGFMNARGGTLFVGVDDEGKVIGLDQDFATLKQKNTDGFEQKLIECVARYLGADLCARVHVFFHTLNGQPLCRVYAEPSSRPVYFQEGSDMRYYLRTGNGTRELNIREATDYIGRHQVSLHA